MLTRFRQAALAATASIATPTALAHGDHGPGGHDRWDLDHFRLFDWDGVDWRIGVGFLLLVAIAAVLSLHRRRVARRKRR
jgi:hypothetical protein